MKYPTDQKEMCNQCGFFYWKFPFRSPKNMCDKCQRKELSLLDRMKAAAERRAQEDKW